MVSILKTWMIMYTTHLEIKERILGKVKRVLMSWNMGALRTTS